MKIMKKYVRQRTLLMMMKYVILLTNKNKSKCALQNKNAAKTSLFCWPMLLKKRYYVVSSCLAVFSTSILCSCVLCGAVRHHIFNRD